jgi:hypothetical protein
MKPGHRFGSSFSHRLASLAALDFRNSCAYAARIFSESVAVFVQQASLRCTCGGGADNKTISKWARALRYASRRKKPEMRLKTFMKDAGGVNAAA